MTSLAKLGVVTVLASYVALAASQADVPRTEQDVKAAYLLNILKFVQRKDLPADRKDITLCLLNSGSVEFPLRALEGVTVGGRRLKILTVLKNDDLLPCEVLFLGRTSGHQAALSKAKNLGLLTIGNDAEFLAKSGMIALVVEGRRVVVQVSSEAIRTSNWQFSSHLLEVARVTSGGGAR